MDNGLELDVKENFSSSRNWFEDGGWGARLRGQEEVLDWVQGPGSIAAKVVQPGKGRYRVSSGPKAGLHFREPLPGGPTFGHTFTPGLAGSRVLSALAHPARPWPRCLSQCSRPHTSHPHTHTPGTAVGNSEAGRLRHQNRRTNEEQTHRSLDDGYREAAQNPRAPPSGGSKGRKAVVDAAPSRAWRTESQVRPEGAALPARGCRRERGPRLPPLPRASPPAGGWVPTLSASDTWQALPRLLILRTPATFIPLCSLCSELELSERLSRGSAGWKEGSCTKQRTPLWEEGEGPLPSPVMGHGNTCPASLYKMRTTQAFVDLRAAPPPKDMWLGAVSKETPYVQVAACGYSSQRDHSSVARISPSGSQAHPPRNRLDGL